ncbi:tetratricopeptide repeat protein [Patescibacteria group bacterium]
MKKTFIYIIISIIYIFSIFIFSKHFLADIYYKMPEAVVLNPNEPTYYRYLAKQHLLEDNEEAAFEDIISAISLNPKNLTTLRNIIPIFYFLGPGYIPQTLEYFAHLKKTYPNDLGILADIAKYEKRMGLMTDFKKTYEIGKKLRPDLVEWHESFENVYVVP